MSYITIAGLPISRILIVFLPFSFMFTWTMTHFLEKETDNSELNKILRNSTMSLEEKNRLGMIEGLDVDSDFHEPTFIERQNAKLNILGIPYKFEKCLVIAGILFIIGCMFAVMVIKAGILLMLFLGGLCAASIFIYLNGKLDKRKEELTLEFLEKMRDIATYLSVGKSLQNAIYEALESGNISRTMFNELEKVRTDIHLGKHTSEAFMSMYQRLQIEDIRMYAETLAVFEETGGNLITVMKANDKFATDKMELRNEQKVFASGQKTQQKLVIGIPTVFLIGFFILNPSFFGNFYSTILGQIIAIVCISMIVVGVLVSNRLAEIKA